MNRKEIPVSPFVVSGIACQFYQEMAGAYSPIITIQSVAPSPEILMLVCAG